MICQPSQRQQRDLWRLPRDVTVLFEQNMHSGTSSLLHQRVSEPRCFLRGKEGRLDEVSGLAVIITLAQFDLSAIQSQKCGAKRRVDGFFTEIHLIL